MLDFLHSKTVNKVGVGVDIGASSIKVLELHNNNGVMTLATYGSIDLAPYAGLPAGQVIRLGEAKLGEALHDLIEAAKVSIKDVFVNLPMNECFITTITVPDLEGEELKSASLIEARKYIPMPISEVTVNHWPIPRSDTWEKGKREVGIVAVKNTLLTEYANIFKNTSLNIKGYEVEIYSANRTLADASSLVKVLVIIGAESSSVSIVDGGVVVRSAAVSKGGQAITLGLNNYMLLNNFEEAENLKQNSAGSLKESEIRAALENLSYPLLEEIAHMVERLERGYNKKVEKIELMGGGAMMLGIQKLCEDIIHRPCEVRSGFEKVKVPDYLKDLLSKEGPRYSIAAGLAMKSFE